jgi:uncharacterized membrane protein
MSRSLVSRSGSIAAVAAMLAVLALAPAAAQTTEKPFKGTRGAAPRSSGNSADGKLDIKVCNRSEESASVALSFIQPGETRFINRGWFSVNPGECKVLGQTDNATFYAYADVDNTDRAWQGNHPLCVEYPGPYTFYTSESDYCDDDQVTRDFIVMTATEIGTYTWNLDP